MEVVPGRQVLPDVVVNVLVDLDLNLVLGNRRFGSEDGGRGVSYVVGRRCMPHTSRRCTIKLRRDPSDPGDLVVRDLLAEA